MEIQEMTTDEIKLVLCLREIPDVGNEFPMLHVSEEGIDFPILSGLVSKGVMKRPDKDWYAEVRKGYVSFHLTG
jgi:hypothetical protein